MSVYCTHCGAPFKEGATACPFCKTERPGAPRRGPTIDDQQIAALLANGNIIEAIKVYRQKHGVGLKEAKETVEALMKSRR